MIPEDLSRAPWRKSTRSGEASNCVEAFLAVGNGPARDDRGKRRHVCLGVASSDPDGVQLQLEHAAEYETKPYPRAEAILNVHKLACMVYPEAKTVNPLELWDTQTLRNMFASGYVDELYGGRDKVIESISHTLAHGECDD